jgi:hypothetical protein
MHQGYSYLFLYLFALFLQILGTQNAIADDFVSPHARSTIAENARYEIIGSQLVVRDTFRLDRVCGKVDQLVKTKSGDLTWEAMPVEKLPSCVNDGKPHFHIYLSSITAKNSLLINTDNGSTWVLMKVKTDSEETLEWFFMTE